MAAELLAKLLKDEIKTRSKHNIVQSRQFSEMLKNTLNAYHNRAIATQEVIEELINLAKEMDAATKRGIDLGLNDDEIAFYDALAAKLQEETLTPAEQAELLRLTDQIEQLDVERLRAYWDGVVQGDPTVPDDVDHNHSDDRHPHIDDGHTHGGSDGGFDGTP